MLNILPPLHDSEIIYSLFSRYRRLSGNVNYTYTSKELFGIKSAQIDIYYPSHLKNFLSQLPQSWEITANYIINNHSILPVFIPFMTQERREKIIQNIIDGDSREIEFLLGISNGDIFQYHKSKIALCADCYREDVKKHGEALIHVSHQVPGNFVCSKHRRILFYYDVPLEMSKYFYVDINTNADFSKEVKINNNLIQYHLDLANDIDYLLKVNYENYSLSVMKDKYRMKLQEKGYLLFDSRIRREQLIKDFNNFYPKEFLTYMESDIKDDSKKNWLVHIVTDSDRFIHPIRHLLFIRFLFGGIAEFDKYSYDFKPFGYGPWLCLNPISNHYKEQTITECEIKRKGYSTTEFIGVLSCPSCGFTYQKSTKDKDDYQLHGKNIIDYGEEWKQKLEKLILTNSNSIRRITEEMKCHRRTVINEAIKLGLSDKLKVKIEPQSLNKADRLSRYKEAIVDFMELNKDTTRQEIRNALNKEYLYIYTNDREWFESTLPEQQKRNKEFVVDYRYKNWGNQDIEIYKKVLVAIEEILNEANPRRITKTHIAKKIGYFSILEDKYLDKMPLTKEVLDKKCECPDDFSERRRNFMK